MRKMASVRKIDEITSIEGADAIELAHFGGWQVVVKKGEYSVGDLVVYCEIDSWIPHTIAPFLTKAGQYPKVYKGIEGQRLRSIKLRGALSQGLVLPFSTIMSNVDDECSTVDWNIDDDVSDILGIVKYEPPVPTQLAGLAKGNFPSFIPKTDQERIQNVKKHILAEIVQNKVKFEVTLKMDGSSCTVYKNFDEFGVCSRNLNLKLDEENSENAFVKIANDTNLLSALKELGRNIAVQGELMGPGIQGNKEKFESNMFFIFDVWDIDKQEYLGHEERMKVIDKLTERGYIGDHVPVLDVNYTLPTSDVSKLLELAKGSSLFAKIREGNVYKTMDGKFSFKIINNDFLLKCEE